MKPPWSERRVVRCVGCPRRYYVGATRPPWTCPACGVTRRLERLICGRREKGVAEDQVRPHLLPRIELYAARAALGLPLFPRRRPYTADGGPPA